MGVPVVRVDDLDCAWVARVGGGVEGGEGGGGEVCGAGRGSGEGQGQGEGGGGGGGRRLGEVVAVFAAVCVWAVLRPEVRWDQVVLGGLGDSRRRVRTASTSWCP